MKPMQLLSSACLALSLTLSFSSANAATCVGNCGTSGADGDITAPPISETYDWISTDQGISGVGQLSGYSGTNGSTFTTNPFYAEAGAQIDFYFNYVTSDGSGYADYAWAQLQSDVNTNNIFTARTKPTGNIVPGQDLPPVNAVLNPVSVEIQANKTNWSPLGEDSGSCFSSGCGNTGWVKSSYTIASEGTFNLAFGVTNFSDTAYDSGLAFSGVTLDGLVVGDGSSADNALLPQDVIDETGAFVFEFTPTPGETIFIDPDVAVGYVYNIISGDNEFSSVLLPNIGDGIFEVSGIDGSGLSFLDVVNEGKPFDFSPGVKSFTVNGIEVSAGLDPTDTSAFVTGLTFANANTVMVTQTPIVQHVSSVPVPASALLFAPALLGFVGLRRRMS